MKTVSGKQSAPSVVFLYQEMIAGVIKRNHITMDGIGNGALGPVETWAMQPNAQVEVVH